MVLFLVDSTIVNLSVFATLKQAVTTSFEVYEIVPDVVPRAPNAFASVSAFYLFTFTNYFVLHILMSRSLVRYSFIAYYLHSAVLSMVVVLP